MTEETLFQEALSRSPAERAAFLDQACAGQPELRAAVEALLAAHERSGNVLDQPVATGVCPPDADQALPPVKTTDYRPDAEPGVVIAGRYTLVEKIGEGGMGEVWVAKQTEPVKRKVALKLIKTGMDSKAVVQRFEQERQALGMMDHPNIARVLDGGLTPTGQPFFVMELVNGLPLARFCDEAKLGIRERLELFVPICQAVQHAHQKGIVHRDLKPANILVTLYDGKPVPKVIDFGVAKATGGKLTDQSMSTQFGAIIGTLEYMSPEQAGYSGSDIDTRADIYSLGVILYELLTGLRPFDSQRLKRAALDEIVRIIREEEPPRPSTRLSSDASAPSLAAIRQTQPKRLATLMRGELDWVVMKCLEKHRERRYETANGLARDVQRYLADEAVEARPPSAGYRLGKFLKRNKGPVIAASLVLFALLAGIAGSLWQMNRALTAEQHTAEALTQVTGERDAKEKARAAEAQQRSAAQIRLVQIEKGNDILAAIFDDLDVHKVEKEGEELKVVLGKRLKKAAQQLRGEAIGDPLVVAKLQNTLGLSLLRLGHIAEAIPLLEESSNTMRRDLGADHPHTFAILHNLAAAYLAGGQLDKALLLYVQVRDAQMQHLGADHQETLATLDNLAGAYLAAGQLDKALPLLEQVRDVVAKKFGADHPDTLATLNNLARAYQADGQLDKTLLLLQQVRDVVVKKFGADHPLTLTTLNNLAGAYLATGQLDRVVPIYEQVRDAFVRKLGADHPDTLTAMNNLAVAYRAARRLDEAIPLLEQVRDARIQRLGADHLHTLATLANLAGAYQSAGQLDRAIKLYDQVGGAYVRIVGADHPDTLLALHNLAGAYRAARLFEKAIKLYEQVRDAQVQNLGAGHPSTLTTTANLAKAHYAVGSFDQGLPMLQQAAQGIEKRKFQHEHAGPIIGDLIDWHEQQKQFVQAEVWRRKWLAVVKERSGSDSLPYAGELVALGSNLLEQKKWTNAEPVLHESLAIREKKAPNAWTTFNTKSMLGGALLGQKKYADAEPLLVAGYEGMKQREKTIPPQAKFRIPEAIERLVQLYEATDKKDEAAKWRQELEASNAAERKPEGKP